MNEAFRKHVTRVSFNLSLSKTHLWALWAIKTNLWAARRDDASLAAFDIRNDSFITGYRGLENRGLALHIKGELCANGFRKGGNFILTEAGEKVYDLCVIAGLIPEELNENDEVIEDKSGAA